MPHCAKSVHSKSANPAVAVEDVTRHAVPKCVCWGSLGQALACCTTHILARAYVMPGVDFALSSKGLQEPAGLPHPRRDQRWCSVRPAQEFRACLRLELLSCLPAQPQHLLLCVASFPAAEGRTHAQRACLTSVTEFCTQCCSKLSPQPLQHPGTNIASGNSS